MPGEPEDKFKQISPIGRIKLDSPIYIDLETISKTGLFQFLRIANGNEYILDKDGYTIILLENRTEAGFTSIYTPLKEFELKRQLSSLPKDKEILILALFGIKLNPDNLITQERVYTPTEDVRALFIDRLGRLSPKDSKPNDLPEDHFKQLSQTELEREKNIQWESVKNLDDNDPRKILYFRRFTNEFSSSVHFDPQLTRQASPNFKYYQVDNSKKSELPTTKPYETSLEMPKGVKIGIIIGYHHLEKPWGILFMNMFKKQVQFSSDEVEFIIIQNNHIPTGSDSHSSNLEISHSIHQQGITHIIDIHEQLSSLNHYMDNDIPGKKFNDSFRKAGRKNPNGYEYTLDPFIPLWSIEEYFNGNIYPQLQYAVNEQIKKIETLVKNLKG